MNADPNPNERHKGFLDSTPLDDPNQEAQRAARLAGQWEEVRKQEGLVCYFAERYRKVIQGILHIDDIKSAGRLGALKAVQRRDPTMNQCQWRRFLAFWVRRAIQDEIANQAAPIRLPSMENRKRIQRDRPHDRACWALRKVLDHPIRNLVFEQDAPIEDQSEPVDSLIGREEQFALHTAVEALPPSEREIIKSAFGLGRTPRSIAQIAAQNEVSDTTARKYHRIAIERLHNSLKSRIGNSPTS